MIAKAELPLWKTYDCDGSLEYFGAMARKKMLLILEFKTVWATPMPLTWILWTCFGFDDESLALVRVAKWHCQLQDGFASSNPSLSSSDSSSSPCSNKIP